jgi:hypothetical protein
MFNRTQISAHKSAYHLHGSVSRFGTRALAAIISHHSEAAGTLARPARTY